MKNEQLKRFQCFSPNLTNFLVYNGVFPTKMYFHHKTKRRCWKFVRNEQLNKLLKEWNETKV